MRKADLESIAPRDPRSGGPVFDEPWQAQVLALAYGLAEHGVFAPSQWSKALGAALQEADTAGRPDGQETYYTAALVALEQLVAQSGVVTGATLDERIETWRRAYLNTPHGQPVELEAGSER